MGRIRNKDIAEALNISTAAVSMAINNKPGVSDETREKVLAMLQASGENVGSSKEKREKMLLLSVHKRHSKIIIEKPFFSELIEAIQMEASKEECRLMVNYCNEETDMRQYIRSLNKQELDGVIVLATEMRKEDIHYYQKLQCRYVLLDAEFDGEQADTVSIDNAQAVLKSYEYAWSMGHREIGYLKCNVDISNFAYRMDGFMKGRRLHTLADAPVVFELSSNALDAYCDMNRILDTLPAGYKMPTCFIADLDYIAIGAMRSLQEHGYNVPDDISMIGFDDVNVNEIYGASLTTVHLHQKTMGRLAVQILMNHFQRADQCSLRVHVSSDLVIRGSVKKLTGI